MSEFLNWEEAPEGCTEAMVADFDSPTIKRGTVEFLTGGFFSTRDCYQEGLDGWIFVRKPE